MALRTHHGLSSQTKELNFVKLSPYCQQPITCRGQDTTFQWPKKVVILGVYNNDLKRLFNSCKFLPNFHIAGYKKDSPAALRRLAPSLKSLDTQSQPSKYKKDLIDETMNSCSKSILMKTRSSEMNIALDIKNHLRSNDLFRSMIIQKHCQRHNGPEG